MSSLSKIILFFLINIIFCEIEYGKNIDDKCSVNLQCISGCCQNDKCVDSKKCKDFRNKIYAVVAVVGAALAIIFTIYLLISLYFIRKNFREKAKKKRATDGNQVKVDNKDNK